ncbi:aldo/keto reductase [Pseudotamlana agarivorans]|uniref:aldo/keto reductase n=1 Tax=Pseudotamlana agarivorans TaxID=481183 RepID=UPI0008372B93|nr:aldo/keto reductase [Tamlana agarivorans]
MELTSYKTLGKSGLRISPLTLGTMTFGKDWGYGTSPENSVKILEKYIALGGNTIDTANIYTKGHSEKIIGDYIKGNNIRRDRLVLSTKFFGNMYPGDPNGGGTSRKTMITSLENSLRRLKTDYIDLFWVHAYDEFTPIEETLSALHDLVTSGKVRYIAISDTPAWKISQAQMIAHFRGWSSFIGLQVEYSLLERTSEGELIPMAQELGLGVMPWSPLKQGVLTGKYTRDNKGEKLSDRYDNPAFSESTYSIIDGLLKIAKEKNVTPGEIALAWVISRPGVTSTLMGVRTMDHLTTNLNALKITLTKAEQGYLDDISKPDLNFPIPFLETARNVAHAGATINGITSVVPDILLNIKDEKY